MSKVVPQIFGDFEPSPYTLKKNKKVIRLVMLTKNDENYDFVKNTVFMLFWQVFSIRIILKRKNTPFAPCGNHGGAVLDVKSVFLDFR